MPVLMIALANIKKKKSVAISMGLLILLAVAVFNVGLTLLAGIGRFYEMENNRLMGPHYLVRFAGNEYREEYLDFFKRDSRVEIAETEESVLMDMASFPQGGVISANFLNMDTFAQLDGYQITERTEAVPEEEAVYIPVFMKEMGYELGDTLTFQYNKNDYSFRVAGFSQSTWLHSSVSSLVNLHMPKKAYERLYEQLGGGYLLAVRLHDRNELNSLQADFKEQTDVKIEAVSLNSKVMELTIGDMQNGSTMVVTTLSAVLFAFSFLMVVVALIVMKFRISNHIDSQMRNIGALGAVGYTGEQIRWSIVLEFLLIGLAGTCLGIGASYGLIAGLGSLITSSVGVTWKSGGHIGFDLLSAGTILAIVLFVAWRAAAAAARILPVDALRGGIRTHSFQREHVPLEKTKLPLCAALGLKSMMFSRWMYLMIGMIFAGVAFACSFAIIVYWNMGINDELTLRMTGYEISDVMVYKAPHADYETLRGKLAAVDGVRKVSHYEMESIQAEGELLGCYVSDDYGQLEMVDVYEGDFPKYDNEIVVTGLLAKNWGKQIGDTVRVTADGASADYIICGFGQTMNNFGRQCFIHESGFLRLNPYYEKSSIQVYLEPGIEIDHFIGMLEQQFRVLSPSKAKAADAGGDAIAAAKKTAEEKLAALISMYGADSAQYALMVDGKVILSGDTSDYEIDRIENNRMMFVTSVDSISVATKLMSLLILAGTVLVIVLVLYMVIKSMLTRRRREFGIYKAIGYTDSQLMKQISISFLPGAAAGTAAGSLLACLTVNRISSILFEKLGISKLDFAVQPGVIILMGILLVAFAYGISMVLARRIKGITVYGLLTEE